MLICMTSRDNRCVDYHCWFTASSNSIKYPEGRNSPPETASFEASSIGDWAA